EAKLIALHAVGLADRVDKNVLDVIERFGMLQIDSVNVFERAHYMPIFSRLGSYDKNELDSLTGGKNPTLIEYWAHQASFIKTSDFPLFDWRMQWYRDRASKKDSFENQNRKLINWIKAELRANGPMTSGDFEHEENIRQGSWWGWSNVKRTLERMIFQGELIAAGRTNFRRLYALPEQVIPTRILNKSVPHDKAQLQLLDHAAKLMGVGTIKDIANVYCQYPSEIKLLLNQLLDKGVVHEVLIQGWKDKAFIHRDYLNFDTKQVKPKLTTILSPFDPLTWQRDRAFRLFNFDYKIEIYTPEPKRIYGYYTLPTLYKDKLVARIDLKSDRQNKALLIQSAWLESHLPKDAQTKYAKAINKHLDEVRKWQQLERIESKGKGNFPKV
ncbi:MAG: winged helix-turn-helix domain-containing protein, partial [Microbacteriaceae bacterium]|nr:winged helix-turn-helix domain-containing protein [Microbacteriaceae bacterium]